MWIVREWHLHEGYRGTEEDKLKILHYQSTNQLLYL